jgi:hypothetical protein
MRGGARWLDANGLDRYSAVRLESTVHVVQSREWAVGRWGSPCIPYQVSANVGEGHTWNGPDLKNCAIYYALPEWAQRKDK